LKNMPITIPKNREISGTSIGHGRVLPAMRDPPKPVRAHARNRLTTAVVAIHSAPHDLRTRAEKGLYHDAG
jgi:hypothetical protein